MNQGMTIKEWCEYFGINPDEEPVTDEADVEGEYEDVKL